MIIIYIMGFLQAPGQQEAGASPGVADRGPQCISPAANRCKVQPWKVQSTSHMQPSWSSLPT